MYEFWVKIKKVDNNSAEQGFKYVYNARAGTGALNLMLPQVKG